MNFNYRQWYNNILFWILFWPNEKPETIPMEDTTSRKREPQQYILYLHLMYLGHLYLFIPQRGVKLWSWHVTNHCTNYIWCNLTIPACLSTKWRSWQVKNDDTILTVHASDVSWRSLPVSPSNGVKWEFVTGWEPRHQLHQMNLDHLCLLIHKMGVVTG